VTKQKINTVEPGYIGTKNFVWAGQKKFRYIEESDILILALIQIIPAGRCPILLRFPIYRIICMQSDITESDIKTKIKQNLCAYRPTQESTSCFNSFLSLFPTLLTAPVCSHRCYQSLIPVIPHLCSQQLQSRNPSTRIHPDPNKLKGHKNNAPVKQASINPRHISCISSYRIDLLNSPPGTLPLTHNTLPRLRT